MTPWKPAGTTGTCMWLFGVFTRQNVQQVAVAGGFSISAGRRHWEKENQCVKKTRTLLRETHVEDQNKPLRRAWQPSLYSQPYLKMPLNTFLNLLILQGCPDLISFHLKAFLEYCGPEWSSFQSPSRQGYLAQFRGLMCIAGCPLFCKGWILKQTKYKENKFSAKQGVRLSIGNNYRTKILALSFGIFL